MELYFAIVNILDYMALHETEHAAALFSILDTLAAEYARQNDTEVEEVIQDIASANDAENADNWTDIINAFKALYASGERI